MDAPDLPFLKGQTAGFKGDHLALEKNDEIEGRRLGEEELFFGQPVLKRGCLVSSPCGQRR
jgi:hypothetical protein